MPCARWKDGNWIGGVFHAVKKMKVWGKKKKGIVLDIMNCSHILIIDGQSHLLMGTRM